MNWDRVLEITIDTFLYVSSFVIVGVVLIASFYFMIKFLAT